MSNAPRLNVPFYRLTEVELRQHYKDNLINTTGYLFYIRHIVCPPNKQFIVPNIVKFCEQWGIARPSFYRAVDHLKSKGYMTWEATHGLIFIDTSKVIDFIPSDGKCLDNDTVSHFRTEVIKDGQAVSKVDNETHKQDSDIYIDCARVQINSDLTESTDILPPTPQRQKEGERKFGFEIKQEAQPASQILVKPDIAPMRVDPFFNRRRDPKDISWDWLPDGPWRTAEGKLDNEFRTAIAKRWVKDYGGDLHIHRAKVLKHFRNEPTNLPIEWEWYQETTIHRAANIQTRKVNGLDTASDEQEIVKHSAALRELPEDMRVTESKTASKLVEEVAGYASKYVEQVESVKETPVLESVATVTDDCWDKIASDMSDMESLAMNKTSQNAPEGAENHDAYKQIVKPEDRDYWAKINCPTVKSSPRSAPVISAQQIKEQVEQINKARNATIAQAKAKKLEQARIAFWNNQLQSGNASAIASTHEQVKKAGYIIVNGQIEDVEF